MGSLKDTKKRIVSAKNTQKITRAMKLVASAKYSRSLRTLLNARPYREGIGRLALDILSQGETSDALLVKREEEKILILVIATDRGLCGALNTNLFKRIHNFVKKQGENTSVSVGLWGRKAVAFGKKLGLPLWLAVEKRQSPVPYAAMELLAENLSSAFMQGTFDAVYVAYAQFENALTQKATISKIIPLSPEFLRGARLTDVQKTGAAFKGNELLEPGRQLLLAHLLRSYLAAEIFFYFLSSLASENAARMTAMDNATNNADEVIRKLTLEYNQARQAAITRELIEITSGAEAL